eukprot:6479034-Amphidinium_carterae.1
MVPIAIVYHGNRFLSSLVWDSLGSGGGEISFAVRDGTQIADDKLDEVAKVVLHAAKDRMLYHPVVPKHLLLKLNSHGYRMAARRNWRASFGLERSKFGPKKSPGFNRP